MQTYLLRLRLMLLLRGDLCRESIVSSTGTNSSAAELNTCHWSPPPPKQATVYTVLKWNRIVVFFFLSREQKLNSLTMDPVYKGGRCSEIISPLPVSAQRVLVTNIKLSMDKSGIIITYSRISENNLWNWDWGKAPVSQTQRGHHLYERGPMPLSHLHLIKAAIEQTNNVWFSLRGRGAFTSHTRNSENLKFQSDSKENKLNNLSKPAVFTFTTVICSVLNEAGKLTSIFGFQQARNVEKEADCRPGRKKCLYWTEPDAAGWLGGRQMGGWLWLFSCFYWLAEGWWW